MASWSARAACGSCRATRSATSRSRRSATQRPRSTCSPRGIMALVRAAASGAGRRDLPDRRVHRPAPRRAGRAALARRRLRAPSHPCRRLPPSERFSPKSGKVRSIPMAPLVAETLARLAQREERRRGRPRVPRHRRGTSSTPRPLSPLKTALKRAELRDRALPRPAPHLRHAGDRQPPSRSSSSRGVDGPCGRRHDDEVHYAPRAGDADSIAEAFAPPSLDSATSTESS